ncbi:hypothetical protein AVEN_36596-1 [Araneus ventricosus]|uniref:Uncharacterized protein n=1 Tax=Araneus ventricosus TaxID=182803 RepID=A0A4Y2PQ98_ARAVE|nr:hypothetical protein AVEN_36596-1 [Araneus ventricosus]
MFNPLGRLKCLLQEIWDRGIDWDENLRLKWFKWCEKIEKLGKIVVPRNYLKGCRDRKVEVDIFCDASPKAYGAVSYLRFVDRVKGFEKATIIFGSECPDSNFSLQQACNKFDMTRVQACNKFETS